MKLGRLGSDATPAAVRPLIAAAVLAMAVGFASPASAGQPAQDEAAARAPVRLAAATVAHDMAEGEVRRIDRDAAKVTLKHGVIKNLDMPPMTMVFGVQDKALLEGLKAGDRVKFKAIEKSGTYTVTELELLK